MRAMGTANRRAGKGEARIQGERLMGWGPTPGAEGEIRRPVAQRSKRTLPDPRWGGGDARNRSCNAETLDVVCMGEEGSRERGSR